MIEELLINIMLLKVKLISIKDYTERLDLIFLENENSELLLDLECSIDHKLNDKEIISHYTSKDNILVDYNKFGELLFKQLNSYYEKKDLDIKDFGRKMYELWDEFSEEIKLKEPFHTLSYADDCLSYGDEEQTRELYEKAFKFDFYN